jgi:hypothetical protein
MIFSPLLSELLVERSSLFRVIGVENMKSSTPFSPKLASPTKSLALTHTNKMDLLKQNIDTLSKLAFLY